MAIVKPNPTHCAWIMKRSVFQLERIHFTKRKGFQPHNLFSICFYHINFYPFIWGNLQFTDLWPFAWMSTIFYVYFHLIDFIRMVNVTAKSNSASFLLYQTLKWVHFVMCIKKKFFFSVVWQMEKYKKKREVIMEPKHDYSFPLSPSNNSNNKQWV